MAMRLGMAWTGLASEEGMMMFKVEQKGRG